MISICVCLLCLAFCIYAWVTCENHIILQRQLDSENGEKKKLMDEAAKYRSQESVLRQSVEQKQVSAKLCTFTPYTYI